MPSNQKELKTIADAKSGTLTITLFLITTLLLIICYTIGCVAIPESTLYLYSDSSCNFDLKNISKPNQYGIVLFSNTNTWSAKLINAVPLNSYLLITGQAFFQTGYNLTSSKIKRQDFYDWDK